MLLALPSSYVQSLSTSHHLHGGPCLSHHLFHLDYCNSLIFSLTSCFAHFQSNLNAAARVLFENRIIIRSLLCSNSYMISILPPSKIQSPLVAFKVPHDLCPSMPLWLPFLLHSPNWLYSSHLGFLVGPWTHQTALLLLWDLGLGYSCCLECSSFRSLLKCHLISGDFLYKITTSLSFSFSLLCLIFLYIIYYHQT